MLNAKILDNGNLELSFATDDARDYFMDHNSGDEIPLLCEGLESYSRNGSFAPFDAGHGNPFVGLTSAPCIAESLDYLDDGRIEIEGRCWFYGDYMIKSPIDELIEDGKVIFTLAN